MEVRRRHPDHMPPTSQRAAALFQAPSLVTLVTLYLINQDILHTHEDSCVKCRIGNELAMLWHYPQHLPAEREHQTITTV